MRVLAFAFSALFLAAGPALAGPPPMPTQRIELSKMMGRWYEIARLPNKIQTGCQGGTSEWTKSGEGFSVVQACHKGSLSAQPTVWKAKAKVIDPKTNARLQMTFFNGLVRQEYWVLDYRTDQGWLILGTPGGRAVWLMSERPTLTAAARSQALVRLKQLGYDISRLEFPLPAKN
jgi:Bacterial lipocalin